MILILGAGLAGLSASYHISHDRCMILEKRDHPFGLAYSDFVSGYTWDQGPHVSFTRHEYIRDLFARSVSNHYKEHVIKTGNVFHGHWIDHPAQSNLYQVPEPLRSECLNAFIQTRKTLDKDYKPRNYSEWLTMAFGPKFAELFPATYTRKYWTLDPKFLTTDWVGQRIFYPEIHEVLTGYKGPLSRSTHYITHARYPWRGGFQAFGNFMTRGANIRYRSSVEKIDLKEKKVWCENGECFSYQILINTLPLPIFVQKCFQTTPEILDAANNLSCSQLLLINIEVPHPTQRPENWIYIYDEDKYSTRIHFTEKMAPKNAPKTAGGIQVEVYYSRYKPLDLPREKIATQVIREIFAMGLLDPDLKEKSLRYSIKNIDWANVIFDHQRIESLGTIFSWLEEWGGGREEDEFCATTNWNNEFQMNRLTHRHIFLSGRFGQWKYYWTDDCILRGKRIASMLDQYNI